jgi:hypothetical protein
MNRLMFCFPTRPAERSSISRQKIVGITECDLPHFPSCPVSLRKFQEEEPEKTEDCVFVCHRRLTSLDACSARVIIKLPFILNLGSLDPSPAS